MAVRAPERLVSYERPVQRLPVRIFNATGSILKRFGASALDLSEESLLAAARTRTGLCDFGDDSFREPLRILLQSLDTEAKLHPFGRAFARQQITGTLVNRLRMQADWTRHPEILDENVARPLFILGPPRTGTTLLQNLLASDLANRWLAFWEAHEPSPPPERATYATDPRRRRATRTVKTLDYLAPSLLAIHEFVPHGPEECFPLLSNAFIGVQFNFMFNVPSYGTWLGSHDLIPSYRYYGWQLKLLQWHCPGERWLLKSPVHMFGMDALLAVFPDACIVQCHRDPLKVIPSAASLIATMRGLSTNVIDTREIGEQVVAGVVVGLERCAEARRKAGTGRFHDVHYLDLVRDPMEVVRGIYAHFGQALTPEIEAAMQSCLSRNPQNKRGTHRYSLGQFHLDREMERRRFAAYCDTFHVQAEN